MTYIIWVVSMLYQLVKFAGCCIVIGMLCLELILWTENKWNKYKRKTKYFIKGIRISA